MKRNDIAALFNLFELDVLDAISFFRLLDTDRNGGVDVDEFVMGCLRMRGHSNMIDMDISVQEIKRMAGHVDDREGSLGAHGHADNGLALPHV